MTSTASSLSRAKRRLKRKPKKKKPRDAVRVAVRLRPKQESEQRQATVYANHDSVVIDQISGERQPFDYVCGPRGSTKSLYKNICKDMVQKCCDGQNTTIFAYGQTNSGKTYTMMGDEKNPGIILLSLSDIYRHITNSKHREFKMFVSCVEIYNEQINDLLDPSKKNLRVVYDPQVGAVIKGCTIRATKSPQDLIHCLLEGETNRQVAQTRHNDRSSRSHTIFRISLQHRDKRRNSSLIVDSTLTLVDLAGSESLSTLSNQSQQTECKNINRSLLSLSRVIILLAKKKKNRSQHIPYRDSNLTRILQNSLGGNSNTVILCTVAPVQSCRDETLNTLRFARFAKQVETTVHINERMSDKSTLQKYHKMVKDLKKQIKKVSEKAKNTHQDNKQLLLEKKNILKSLESHKQNDVYMRERMRELECQLSSMSQPQTPASHMHSETRDDASCESSRSRPGTASSTVSESMECVLSGLQERLECVQASIDLLNTKFENFHIPASPIPASPITSIPAATYPPQIEVSVDLPLSPVAIRQRQHVSEDTARGLSSGAAERPVEDVIFEQQEIQGLIPPMNASGRLLMPEQNSEWPVSRPGSLMEIEERISKISIPSMYESSSASRPESLVISTSQNARNFFQRGKEKVTHEQGLDWLDNDIELRDDFAQDSQVSNFSRISSRNESKNNHENADVSEDVADIFTLQSEQAHNCQENKSERIREYVSSILIEPPEENVRESNMSLTPFGSPVSGMSSHLDSVSPSTDRVFRPDPTKSFTSAQRLLIYPGKEEECILFRDLVRGSVDHILPGVSEGVLSPNVSPAESNLQSAEQSRRDSWRNSFTETDDVQNQSRNENSDALIVLSPSTEQIRAEDAGHFYNDTFVTTRDDSFEKVRKMFRPYEQDQDTIAEKMIAQELARTTALQDKLEMAEIERKKREEEEELVMRELIRTSNIYDRIENAEYAQRDELYDRQQTDSDFSVHEVISPEQILDQSFTKIPNIVEENQKQPQQEHKEKNTVIENILEEKSERDSFLSSAKEMMLHDLERSVKYQERMEESLFNAKIEEEEQRQILSEYMRSEDLRERLQTSVHASRIQECTEFDYLAYKERFPEPIYESSSVTCVTSSVDEKQATQKPTFLSYNVIEKEKCAQEKGEREEIEEELIKIEQSNAKIQDISELEKSTVAESEHPSLHELLNKMEAEIREKIHMKDFTMKEAEDGVQCIILGGDIAHETTMSLSFEVDADRLCSTLIYRNSKNEITPIQLSKITDIIITSENVSSPKKIRSPTTRFFTALVCRSPTKFSVIESSIQSLTIQHETEERSNQFLHFKFSNRNLERWYSIISEFHRQSRCF